MSPDFKDLLAAFNARGVTEPNKPLSLLAQHIPGLGA